MKVFVLVQVEEEIHETEGCECGCGEGWETNYETHCSIIKVSTNRKKLEDIKEKAEKENTETEIYNQKLSDDYNALVQAENVRVNALYSEQLVRYKKLFEQYKVTVSEDLNAIAVELYNKPNKGDWFEKAYCEAAYTSLGQYEAKKIIQEYFKRFPELKLNDKTLYDLREKDLKGYQEFQKTQFERPVIKPLITPYQIIEKELED